MLRWLRVRHGPSMVARPRPKLSLPWVLHVTLGMLLCAFPLFDILGFERAFASSLLVAFTSPIVGIRWTYGHPERSPWRLFCEALSLNTAMLLPSVLFGSIVELVKTPCNPTQGLVFFLLLGVCNAAFGTALGLWAAKFRIRALRFGFVILTLASFLGAALWRLYAEPQIFAYSTPFGYWPGSLYDEALEVSTGLWAFRAYSTALTLALVTALGLLNTGKPRYAFGLALCIASATLAYREGGKLGFGYDRSSLRSALARHVQTEHFDIYVDPSISQASLRELVSDHEFRYAQLKDFFKEEPDGRITSFVYRDVRQKQRLMGAGRTQIARPWER